MKHVSASVVLAASVGLAASARASIVYTDIPDIHVLAPTASGTHTNTATFIIDSVQGTGLGLAVSATQAPPLGITSASATITLLGGTGCLLGIQFPPGVFAPYPLAAGESVGAIVPPPFPPPPPTRQWTVSTSSLNLSTYSGPESQNFGYWGGTGYLGISFPAPGGVRYGWVHMSATSYQITILDFAYETDVNTPIVAGAVPAPGTLVVAGLALAGVRRRGRGRSAIADS